MAGGYKVANRKRENKMDTMRMFDEREKFKKQYHEAQERYDRASWELHEARFAISLLESHPVDILEILTMWADRQIIP